MLCRKSIKTTKLFSRNLCGLQYVVCHENLVAIDSAVCMYTDITKLLCSKFCVGVILLKAKTNTKFICINYSHGYIHI